MLAINSFSVPLSEYVLIFSSLLKDILLKIQNSALAFFFLALEKCTSFWLLWFLWVCCYLNCFPPAMVRCCFLLLSRFLLPLVFLCLTVFWRGFLWIYPFWNLLCFLNLLAYIFCQDWEVFRHYSFEHFCSPTTLFQTFLQHLDWNIWVKKKMV